VRKVKEELDTILERFNIQVNNPIVVLNQDASKTFLARSDPEKLYDFFHRSSRLKDCEDLYMVVEENKEKCKIALKGKQESVLELQKECASWTKKWDHYENLKTKKDEVNRLKGELAWAIVRDTEQQVGEIDDRLAKERKKIAKAEDMVEQTKREDKELRAQKKEVEKEIQDIAETHGPESRRVEELKRVAEEKKRQLQHASRAANEVKRKIEKSTRNLETVSKEIDKYKTGKCREYEEKRLERGRQLKVLEEETSALKAQLETSSNHLQHLKADKRAAEEAADNARYAVTGKRQKLQQIKNELSGLQQGEKNKLKMFGDWMPRLVTEINRKKARFNKMPIGPLGAHFTLKENTSNETSRVIETELGVLIKAFCVDSNKDQMVLFEIFRELQLPTKPMIITSKFSDRRHDISRNRVSSPEYITLIDCIQTSDPTVYNCLVDNVSLEKIIIIPSQTEAQSVLQHVDTVPKNLRYAVVESKYQYFPAPNYRSYHKDYNRSRNLLKASIEELVAGLNEQIKGKEAEIKTAEEEQKAEQARVHSGDQLVKVEGVKIQQIRAKITSKNTTIETLKNDEFADRPPDIAALEEDRERFAAELETLNTELDEKQTGLAAFTQEAEVARSAADELDATVSASLEKIEPLKEKLTSTEDGIRRKKKEADYYAGKIGEYRGKMNDAQGEKTKKEADLKEKTERAANWQAERIQTDRTVEAVKKEVVKLQQNLSTLTSTIEPVEVVKKNYVKYRTLYERTKQDLMDLEQMLMALTLAINRRKKGYSLILRATSQMVLYNFTTQLSVRNFVGALEFEHKEKTLIIKVNPSDDASGASGGLNIDRDLKSLSGGERSFTLVAFILSLWNVMDSPFRILDEFDVFMDAVNRRISVSNIINYARDDRKNQFVFLTPLDTANIQVNDDLKIIKLKKLKHNVEAGQEAEDQA